MFVPRGLSSIISLAWLLTVPASSPAQTISGKFYEYQILSTIGQMPLNATQALTSMAAPSINANGTVAFYGQFTGGEGIVAASPTLPATLVSFAPPSNSRLYGLTTQINDAQQVLASDFVPGSPTSYFDRLWIVAQPGTAKTVLKGGAGQAYNSVLSNGSVNVHGDAVVPALDHSNNSLMVSVKTGAVEGQLSLPNSSFPFPQIADTGDILVRVGNQPNSPINLYDQTLQTLKTSIDGTYFAVLGNQPGISSDGLVIAFYGETNAAGASILGPGPGIFASTLEGTSWRLARVTGTQYEVPGSGGNGNGKCDPGEACLPNAELGYDDLDLPVFFSSYSKDTRVAVANLGLGAAGIDDDTFVVSFIATPASASRSNPVLGKGVPLLFSANQGLWTIRVDVQHQLASPNQRVYHPTTAIPVVQVNDQLGVGNKISSISIFDPLANAAKDDTGKIRTMRRGDHRTAFLATTVAGQQLIVKANHLDSDQDGLLDHWETTGIDMDQDGTVDLNLSAMGANPNKRDIFMEIDWLSDQTNASFEPLPGVVSPAPGQTVSPLVDMFTKAPALTGNLYGVRSDGAAPANIPGGITLHIDGGSGVDQAGGPFSVNMGAGPLDGGDQVGESGTSSSGLAEVIYFSNPGSVTPGVNTRAFQDVKDNYFGINDKDGRELAFHYALFVDYMGLEEDKSGVTSWSVASATNTSLSSESALPAMDKGDVVKITGGTGAGQYATVSNYFTSSKLITINSPWTTNPDATSTFAVLQGNQGIAEVFFDDSPDNNSLPGNDSMVALGSNGLLGYVTSPPVGPPVYGTPCVQFRVLAHELGHNLGLRHGGTDQNAHKGTNYLSLMNYDYSDACKPKSTVQSYAGATDPTFNDWANLRYDVADVAFHLGNSLGLALGPNPEQQQQTPEPAGLDYLNQNGPPDHVPPVITIQSPAAGAKVGLTLPMQVMVNATDDGQVASVSVSFDVNGDGDTADSGEKVQATLSGTSYKASFAALSGPTGSRTITVSATDATGNWATKTETVTVAQPNPVPSLISLSPNSATHGGAGFTLTVNGSNFVSGAVVQWNGANRTTTFVNSGQVTAQIAKSDIAAAGTATVTLKNPPPGGGTSNALTFQIN